MWPTMTEESAHTRILDAAEQAFADAGLAGARVAAIAEQAGVNKAMLYYYFDSKDALYQAVLERVFDQILQMATEVGQDGEGPIQATLERFLAGYRQILVAHPAFVRLMIRGALDGGRDVIPIARPRFEQILSLISGMISRGQAEGVLNDQAVAPLVPPMLVATMVFFAVAKPLLTEVTGLPPETLDALWQRNSMEIVMNGLLARNGEDE